MKSTTSIILAAGIGERLGIFETSKPLVKLRGVSLILWAIQRFREVGITDIHVVIRKEDRLIRKELIDYDHHIHFIEQQYEEKGMLGSILSIQASEIRTPFFISPCDLIFAENPLLLFDGEGYRDRISILISTHQGYNALSGAQEKVHYHDGDLDYSKSSHTANAMEVGIYHFTPASYGEFVETSKQHPEVKTVSEIFRRTPHLNPVVMAETEWFDINTSVTLVRADLYLQNKLLPEKKIESVGADFNPLSATASFDYAKRIRFDVCVGQGLVDQIRSYEIIPHEYFYSPHHLLIDKNIHDLYGQKIYDQLLSQGYQVHKHLIDPGENSKSLSCYATIAEDILAVGIEKKSIIISVGGGVIKDLAGFLASTLYRGIGFISFPTTVLSQSDAAIALKQGVNGTRGKT